MKQEQYYFCLFKPITSCVVVTIHQSQNIFLELLVYWINMQQYSDNLENSLYVVQVHCVQLRPGVENIADHGTIGPRKFLCFQKEKREGRKRGKKEKKGKKEKRGKKQKKERKRIERETAPISSHFVQGQTLGVGGAPKIISERTLIAAGCQPEVKKNLCLPEIGKFILL